MTTEEWLEKYGAQLPERDEVWVEDLLKIYGLKPSA